MEVWRAHKKSFSLSKDWVPHVSVNEVEFLRDMDKTPTQGGVDAMRQDLDSVKVQRRVRKRGKSV